MRGGLHHLDAGTSFRVRSRSGNEYAGVTLHVGRLDAGVYVRLSTGKLARLSPDRLDLQSLEVLDEAPELLRAGDELLLTPLGGLEVRGRLARIPEEHIALEPARGPMISVPLTQVAPDTLRLLFRASDLRAGDEFLVKSYSGREYRGHALSVQSDRIVAALSSRGKEGGEKLTLRADHLDLNTLLVLVPVRPALLGCSPANA